MSGSTRAPTSSQELADPSTEAVRDDAYVDRLADRLTGSHAPPAATEPPPPMPAMVRPSLGARRAAPAVRGSIPPPASVPPPPGAGARASVRPPPPELPSPSPPPALESSDVRAMPPVDRDELADFPPSPPSHPPEAFSEFEQDDLAAEATSIEDRDALASESTQILKELPAMPMLFVEAGRDQGREYVLVEGETTVGRGIDNEVILADVSVSRRHLRILRDGDSLVLRDSGSGNGTLVNGRRVHALSLSDGDRIEIGETVLVVRVPGAELAASLSSEPLTLRSMDNTTDETAAPTAGPSFEQSLPSHPESAWSIPPPASSLPPPTPSATSWLPSSGGGDRTGAVVLDRRTLLIAAGGIAIGASVLGALVVAVMLRQPAPEPVASTLPLEPIAIPPLAAATSPSPAPAPTPASAAAVPSPVPAVPSPVPGSTAAVPGSTAAVPGAVPSPVPVPVPVPAPVASAPDRAAPDRAAPDRAAPDRPTPRREPPPPPRTRSAGGGDPYLAPYRSGDFAAAAREARSGGQAARALQIDQFATHYANAQRAPSGSPGSISALERAIAIDNQIVRGGHYGARLRTQLVGSYLDAAQGSIGARPQEACRRVQLALRLDRGSSRGQSLARQCETQAQRLLGEATGIERSDPARARALYQSVLPMVPSTSATYTRARQRVDAMARARSVDEDE